MIHVQKGVPDASDFRRPIGKGGVVSVVIIVDELTGKCYTRSTDGVVHEVGAQGDA